MNLTSPFRPNQTSEDGAAPQVELAAPPAAADAAQSSDAPSAPSTTRRVYAPVAPALNTMQTLSKRILDIVGALGMILVLSPVLITIALIIVFTTGRPVLFRQERIGLSRRPFMMYKFRSMRNGGSDAALRAMSTRELTEENPDAGTSDGIFKVDDPRITPIGAWIRKTSVDELPQLINVLRGEMSLVGPRPVLDWEMELMDPGVDQRFAVLPGITGAWQVGGRSRVTMRRMLEMDREYVEHWSLLNDISILLRTPAAAVRGDGAR